MSYLLSLYNEHIRYVNSRPIKKDTIVNKIYSDISELESSMSCESCSHYDPDTSNSEGNGEYTKGFCCLFGLSKNDRPFKYCSVFEPKEL